jgi:NADH-quinone oxidoreductase subunit G
MTDVASTPPADEVVVTLNGVEISGRKGELLIDAAERNGVYIPRFCYHERMRPVGMCRMCIVEVDTGRGGALQPSCMLEVAPGMKVDTESDLTNKAQEGVLEFLLLNHPLDCPVCDKGGECPLQDQTLTYGPGESRLVEEKRHFEKPIPISDLVLLDRERCILCDRCTRFAKEVAGDPLIHFMSRGNTTEVNTFPDEPFSSYFSGNTVQICPVGALTAAPYRFKARPWDLDESESTCQTCAVGCRVALQSSRDQLLRKVGVDIDPVNWGWLCDKGRFDIGAVDSPDRLGTPLARKGSDLVETRWADALGSAAAAVRAAVETKGPSSVAVIGGSRLTNESAYAWAKLAKGVIGTDNVDAQLGDGLPAEVVLGLPRATIDQTFRPGGTVVMVAPDLKEELPVLFLRLRHAVIEDGVKVIELAPRSTSTTALAAVSLLHRPAEAAATARALLGGDVPGKDAGGVDRDALAAARALLDAADGPLTVILGRPSLAEAPEFTVDVASVFLAHRPDTVFLSALRRGNVHGALDAGLAPGIVPGRVALTDASPALRAQWPQLPSQPGLDTAGILAAAADGRIEVLVLVGVDPVADFGDRSLAEAALATVPTVITTDLFLSESSQRAHLVLPAAGPGEQPGTTTNLEGRVSTVSQQVTPPGTARADWMIASELAHLLGADLGLESPEQIFRELESVAPAFAGCTYDLLTSPAGRDGIVVPLPAVQAEPEPASTVEDATPDDTDGSEGEEPSDGEAASSTEPAPVAAPPLLRFEPGPAIEPPALDAYGLRLVATRKLYDHSTMVVHTPALADLPAGTALAVNPYDFARFGVQVGNPVRIASPRGAATIAVVADAGVPRGSAHIFLGQDQLDVTALLDSSQRVTDLRIDTGATK